MSLAAEAYPQSYPSMYEAIADSAQEQISLTGEYAPDYSRPEIMQAIQSALGERGVATALRPIYRRRMPDDPAMSKLVRVESSSTELAPVINIDGYRAA